MKIISVVQTYYPRVGGAEYVVKSIAERLVRMGHRVTVIAGEPDIERPREECLSGVNVIRWPTYAPNAAYHLPRYRSSFEKKLNKLLEDTDIFHLHNIHALITYFAWKSWRNKQFAKLVVTPYYHGTGHTMFRRVLWIAWRSKVAEILRSADVVHTVSRNEARHIREEFKIDPIVIENGVEEFLLTLRWEPSNYIMYSGRIEKYKNIDRLIHIAKIIKEEYEIALDLVVIGDGPYRHKLITMLRNYPVKWIWKPFQPFEKYIDMLSKARFFALLSEKESYPQSVNEANAIGTPVVIAKPWGTNFSKRRRTLIVDLGTDDRDLTRRIIKFLEDVQNQPRSDVPTWNDVTRLYLSKLYSS